MRTVLAGWMAALVLAGAAQADGEKAGVFDYYVLALSWTPNWCALEGDARNSDQCHPRHEFGWTLHGLWPQYHRGWPAYCPTVERAPSRSMTGSMTDIMGSSGLAWHQWRKHGVCTGESAAAYFETSRAAYGKVTRPEVFRKLEDPVTLPASVVEAAFLRDNPGLTPEAITVTCKSGHIQEVRICLGKDLAFVPCGRDVSRDCSLEGAMFAPIR
ncbi:ribonuclease T2 family protein [Pseudaestuariivita sp.]|uniref:ribonuclease T2 family protein n=1 Tax=Pseudaestuariivita sp. TaxID=2211669 RepID=UPI004057F4C3